ncbi:TPA: hypothetical protein JBG74_11795 [Legionella pneumophila]|uniref:Uncharacterized protein n=2 Tax=Legionella pneumophila TaxID=446 RepID=Q5ZTG7_LEGPH|nr:hypothetical protein lpg2195 [Legionella pneumophila subsp. pneumophila str. Philadelphia 1]AEW52435.1 hypothetical protein lp12_2187 [Legionella pneumophila subsp. pneumophila ATCC 43290]AGH52994.1 hypothetical protein LPE509_00903 [Legionella pneumophila subsp. pneumophila LPE509]AGN15116.1 hypothetical protein LP6_2222 [Legionella pneumophila subsp. pneumophila str. Thunder Bay]AOU05153.1 hypothetical protein A9E97_10750 [Legionella pneumophila]PNL77457.1 hypothetical protein A6J41_00584
MSHPGKKKILFSILYSLRHLIALLVMSVGIYLIKTVTAILYLPSDYSTLPLLSLCGVLWLSNDFFLRFILVVNFIIKPFFLYLGVLFCFYYLHKKCCS